ncbi:MAG: histidinol-phosphate transaminase [Pirellula sp.]|jgi:histidinol-phosphate aminotransferase|nr:histidinol-phosphate transaminase [Pirellula sp.]
MMDTNKYFRPEIVRMAPYKPGEQPGAAKVIKLNTNESPYPPSPRVREAIAAASERLERYPDPLGTSFRRVAADVLGVSADQILCGNGSDDILTILTRAFVGHGERLRLPFPSYILYRTLAELQGAQFEEIPFDRDFQLSDAYFQPQPNLKLVFLPNPNSPSGTQIPPETILELAQRLDCPIVVDEAYVDFAPQHCVGLVAKDPRIMVTRTLSKSYALAGLRFGYLVAHESIIQVLRKVKDSYNTDAISIAGATAAIADQSWLKENVARMQRTRARMVEWLQALGFDVTPSHANFVWCTRKDRPVEPIYAALKARGILVRYMNYAPWGDGLRISVGTDEEIDALHVVLRDIISS